MAMAIASLFPNPALFCSSSSCSSLSSSSSIPLVFNFRRSYHGRTLIRQDRIERRQKCRSTAEDVASDMASDVADAAAVVSESFPGRVASLKLNLLSAISGLNRGLAATEEDLKKAESAAKELEAEGGIVDLTKDLDKLQGRWKLIYSSAFSSRTLGGSRPGPPIGRLLPITLGLVFQRIDVLSKDFDNIVELQFATPWPIPPIQATATLAHKFEVIGTSNIKINFEKTTVKPTGSFSQLPPLDIPRLPDALRSSSNTGNGEFEVTYFDSDLRITRGDRGELRVFVIS
ncbi:plastid-lipid associated protein PAP / fibrillin family protein [Carex rostrata]